MPDTYSNDMVFETALKKALNKSPKVLAHADSLNVKDLLFSKSRP